MPKILDREVGPIGYGLQWHTLGLSVPPEEKAIESMKVAADLGCLLWNGAEFYGRPDYNSLVLLNRFFTKYPEYANKVVINIKGALEPQWKPNGEPEFVKKSVSSCLAQLGGKGKINMFEAARKDPDVPFETTLKALKELADEGKIESVALSEVNANSIREASKIVNISAVEIELSLWCTEPLTNGITKICAELNIPIIAYCPLGRGMLAGNFHSPEALAEKDFRRIFPRYQTGNFETNLRLVKEIQALAQEMKRSPAQLALGWLLGLSKRPDMPIIIPIPGATSLPHVRENAESKQLTEEEMKAVDRIIASCPVAGERYHPDGMKLTNM